MIWQEGVNIFFEVFCAGAAWINVWKLVQDKQVKGIVWSVWIIYTMWRFWDILYMYPALHMPYATVLALGSAIGQAVWCVLVIRYKRQALTQEI
jgi:hypothetical protein